VARYLDRSATFWYNGFDGVGFFEDAWNDRNTTYHTINDRVQYLHQPYYLKMAKLALGTLAFLACNSISTSPTPMRQLFQQTHEHHDVSHTGAEVGAGSRAPRLYYGQVSAHSTAVHSDSGTPPRWDIRLKTGSPAAPKSSTTCRTGSTSTVVTTCLLAAMGSIRLGAFPTAFTIPDWRSHGRLDEANDMIIGRPAWNNGTYCFHHLFTDSPGGDYFKHESHLQERSGTKHGKTFLEFDTQWA
jgi:hypothetical protein